MANAIKELKINESCNNGRRDTVLHRLALMKSQEHSASHRRGSAITKRVQPLPDFIGLYGTVKDTVSSPAYLCQSTD
jgi:hypothetical protein